MPRGIPKAGKRSKRGPAKKYVNYGNQIKKTPGRKRSTVKKQTRLSALAVSEAMSQNIDKLLKVTSKLQRSVDKLFDTQRALLFDNFRQFHKSTQGEPEAFIETFWHSAKALGIVWDNLVDSLKTEEEPETADGEDVEETEVEAKEAEEVKLIVATDNEQAKEDSLQYHDKEEPLSEEATKSDEPLEPKPGYYTDNYKDIPPKDTKLEL